MTTATRHPVELRYATASDVESGADGSRIRLALEGSRGTVGVSGRVTDARPLPRRAGRHLRHPRQ
ncbi:hypothetical protein ACLEPN_27975 [Myxococcus sp. 1LA]